MADGTKIEWADATVNAVNGCSVVSPGCTNCYAMRLAGTRLKHHPSRVGLTESSKAGPVWIGDVRLNKASLLDPLRWKRPRRIFWNAHGDLFHENVPDDWIDKVFAVCALAPQHTHMILTKRSKRMRDYCSAPETVDRIYDLVCNWAIEGIGDVVLIAPKFPAELAPEGRHVPLGIWPLPNIWLGVSVEDQVRADERIPDLRATRAAIRFISAEPLLGPVDLRRWIWGWHPTDPVEMDRDDAACDGAKIDWVIVGGESGLGARAMHPDWARSLRDQCQAADVSFHFKQWGEWAPISLADRNGAVPCQEWSHGAFRPWANNSEAAGAGCDAVYRVGKKVAGRLLDGVQHDGYPA